MFRDDGTPRSDAQNLRLAAALALVAGFVNSAGFLLVGSFTSHVTGNLGRMVDDVVTGDLPAGLRAAVLVSMFFVGAFAASFVMESRRIARARVHAVLLVVESALLGLFLVLADWLPDLPYANDAVAITLCVAMGMQNSFVTRLSDAVVRTTHLTGTVTDLGIESARWLHFWRGSGRTSDPSARPSSGRLAILLSLLLGFTLGSALGGVATVRWGANAMLAPVATLLALAASAFASNRTAASP